MHLRDDLIIMQYPAQQWRERKDKKTEESYKDTKSLPLCSISSFTKVQRS